MYEHQEYTSQRDKSLKGSSQDALGPEHEETFKEVSRSCRDQRSHPIRWEKERKARHNYRLSFPSEGNSEGNLQLQRMYKGKRAGGSYVVIDLQEGIKLREHRTHK